MRDNLGSELVSVRDNLTSNSQTTTWIWGTMLRMPCMLCKAYRRIRTRAMIPTEMNHPGKSQTKMYYTKYLYNVLS